MLSALAGPVIAQIASGLIGKVADVFIAYQAKQISRDQLQAEVARSLLATIGEVEKSQADALAATYASFMQAAKSSIVLQVAWASVVISQLGVLLWHQIGIPALVYLSKAPYPSSGATVEWAYLLLAGMLGLGPVVLNGGPGKVPIERLTSIIRR